MSSSTADMSMGLNIKMEIKKESSLKLLMKLRGWWRQMIEEQNITTIIIFQSSKGKLNIEMTS